MLRIISRGSERALALARSQDYLAPLLARITVGVVFITSGWGKLHNLDKVTQFFGELGIPAPAFQAVFVSYVELVCGTALLLGLLTRLVAIPLAATMGVAIITAKAEEIAGVADLLGTVEFAYVALLFGLVLTGPGKVSLDALLFGKRSRDLTTRAVALNPSL
ncbi:MAG: DoxX family protein [Polyangiaceae bacterium]